MANVDQPLFDELTTITLNNYRDTMFRDYLVQQLGPSPLLERIGKPWPFTREQAEEIADSVMAKMKEEPDKGIAIMQKLFEP